MKVVTREDLVRLLASESNFYQKDVRVVLQSLERVILDCFDEITDNESIQIQLTPGIKLHGKVIPRRNRVDPRTREPIVCEATIKPQAVFSSAFRKTIQEQYDVKQKDN